MSIIAKKVSPDGQVKDVELKDRPSDVDIIGQIEGADNIASAGCSAGYEVIEGTACGRRLQPRCRLILRMSEQGYGSAEGLTDGQARNLAALSSNLRGHTV